MYEDVEPETGVAYNTENFDEEYTIGASLFDDFSCDGCFEDCIYGDDAPKYCQAYKQCREDYETL